MSSAMTARKERGHLIVTLLRVRAVVYLAGGTPLLFVPGLGSRTVLLSVAVLLLSMINPFLVRALRVGSGVQAAAVSDLVIAYGLWLAPMNANGLALMLAMLAIGYAVFLGPKRESRFVMAAAVVLELSKLVVVGLANSTLAFLSLDAVSEGSPLVILGAAAGLGGGFLAFNLIDDYFRAVGDAAQTGEEQYRKLMDTAPVGFIVVVEHLIVYANEAAETMLAPGGGTIVATKIVNYVAKSSARRFREIRRQVLNLWETVENQEFEFRDINNHLVWVNLSANAVEYGSNLAMQLMVHDRSGQVIADEQLRQTRLDYQTFFERIPVALYRSHSDGSISHVNGAFVKLVGATSEDEIIGRNARSYYADESERDRLSELLVRAGVVSGYEWQLKTHNGSVRWVRDTSRLIKSARGQFYEGVLVDVTARRRIEDELWSRAAQQEAAASIGQMALESNNIGELCEALSAVVSQVLATDGVVVLKRDAKGVLEVVGADSITAIDATVFAALADRSHMIAAPVLIRSATDMRAVGPALLEQGYKSCVALVVPGKEIHFGTLVALSRDERGFTPDDVNFLQAVASMLAAAAERAGVNSRLKALVESKDAFVASVSHELRTPLTVVSGLAHELHQRWMTLSDDEMVEFTSMLIGQSEDMADLIEDLLVTARANIGNVAVQIMPVSVAKEVSGVLASFASQTDVDIKSHVGDVTVDADPIRLRQILRNLVSNAIRYGGNEIEVVVGVRGCVGVIEVRDSGDPIAESDRERIFEPYERAYETAGRPGSVGLGLSVSRILAELMKGGLTYYHDGMSVFRLELPSSVANLDSGPTTWIDQDQSLGAFGTVGSSRIGVDADVIP